MRNIESLSVALLLKDVLKFTMASKHLRQFVCGHRISASVWFANNLHTIKYIMVRRDLQPLPKTFISQCYCTGCLIITMSNE